MQKTIARIHITYFCKISDLSKFWTAADWYNVAIQTATVVQSWSVNIVGIGLNDFGSSIQESNYCEQRPENRTLTRLDRTRILTSNCRAQAIMQNPNHIKKFNSRFMRRCVEMRWHVHRNQSIRILSFWMWDIHQNLDERRWHVVHIMWVPTQSCNFFLLRCLFLSCSCVESQENLRTIVY